MSEGKKEFKIPGTVPPIGFWDSAYYCVSPMDESVVFDAEGAGSYSSGFFHGGEFRWQYVQSEELELEFTEGKQESGAFAYFYEGENGHGWPYLYVNFLENFQGMSFVHGSPELIEHLLQHVPEGYEPPELKSEEVYRASIQRDEEEYFQRYFGELAAQLPVIRRWKGLVPLFYLVGFDIVLWLEALAPVTGSEIRVRLASCAIAFMLSAFAFLLTYNGVRILQNEDELCVLNTSTGELTVRDCIFDMSVNLRDVRKVIVQNFPVMGTNLIAVAKTRCISVMFLNREWKRTSQTLPLSDKMGLNQMVKFFEAAGIEIERPFG